MNSWKKGLPILTYKLQRVISDKNLKTDARHHQEDNEVSKIPAPVIREVTTKSLDYLMSFGERLLHSSVFALQDLGMKSHILQVRRQAYSPIATWGGSTPNGHN